MLRNAKVFGTYEWRREIRLPVLGLFGLDLQSELLRGPQAGTPLSPFFSSLSRGTKFFEFLSLYFSPFSCWKMAEREGFEPPVGLPPQRFSKPPLSTTQPSLHGRRFFSIH